MAAIQLRRIGTALGLSTCLALLLTGSVAAQTSATLIMPSASQPTGATSIQGGDAPAATQPTRPAVTAPTPNFITLPPDVRIAHDSSPAEKAEPTEIPGLFDNLSLFAGLDGSKAPEDLGVNANFGGRVALNWGLPVCERLGLGVQLGTAYNFSATAVKLLETAYGIKERDELFTTVGLFQRTEFGLKWGFAYDFLYEHYYSGMDLGQWRGQLGYEFRPSDEAGVWCSIREHGDQTALSTLRFGIQPITQANLYYRHIWSNQADTRLWVGVAERHSKFNLIFQGSPPAHDALVFGAEINVPLNNWIALYGEANFITPNDTGLITATLGLAIYPGGRALNAAHSRFAPMLPVANNSSFAIDVDR